MSDIERFAPQNPPQQEIKEAHIRRTEYGRLQVQIDAPLIVRSDDPSPRTIYPHGVDLRFFNEDGSVGTDLHAGKAVSFDDRNVLQGSDSVVVVDYCNGDTVYLQDIVWRQDDDIIFSNHPVRSVGAGRVTYGDGFTSDERMTNLRILHQRGTIEIDE